MEVYDVKIKGTAPLLQNKPPVGEATEKKGEGHDSSESAEGKLYMLDGKICQPAIHIEQALMKASSSIKMKGSGKKTYKDMFKGSVFIKPDYIPHLNQKWEVHAAGCVIPSTRGRVMRYRPMLKTWSLEFQIEALDDRLPEEVLKLVLDEAGRSVGIGDYRPRFGRFIVERFKKA